MQRLATALLVPALLVLLVVAGVAPTAVGESATSGATNAASNETYAGAHVSFAIADRAVTDYAVDGETMLDSVRVAPGPNVTDSGASDANSLGADPDADSGDADSKSADANFGDGDATDVDSRDADSHDANRSLPTVTSVEGAPLTVEATTETEVRLAAGNGATVAAHDNRRGVLAVASGEGVDHAVVDLPEGANATPESDSQVEISTANGTRATLLVVGEGSVAVDDAGGVTARLGDGGRLVFRAYPEGKEDADETREALVADGAAAAEVYVRAASGNATGSEGIVVDAVSYDRNATVEVERAADGEVSLAVNRTTSEGTVLLASVSDAVLNASADVEVAVDGEPATKAVTHSQLEGAVGSHQSRYVVDRSGGGAAADATDATEIAVGVNNLDGRTVSIRGPAGATPREPTTGTATTTEEGSASDGATAGDDSDTSGDDSRGVPGFTPVTAGVALLVAGLLAVALLARTR